MKVNELLNAVKQAFAKGAKVVQATQVEQDKKIQALVDYHVLNCTVTKAEYLKGNSVKNENRAQIKGLFDGLVESGYIQSSAGRNYQTSFWLAFEHNVPFQRDLFKSFKKSNEGKTKTPKSGKVVEYTLESALKTLGKSLYQLRKVNQVLAVSALLDTIFEFYPEFQEPSSEE
jgi:hypothetical protein